MGKAIHCSDVGFDCEGVVRADSDDEAVRLAAEHAQKVRGPSEITSEIGERQGFYPRVAGFTRPKGPSTSTRRTCAGHCHVSGPCGVHLARLAGTSLNDPTPHLCVRSRDPVRGLEGRDMRPRPATPVRKLSVLAGSRSRSSTGKSASARSRPSACQNPRQPRQAKS
jgi:predicted small metal-binding protein